MARKYIFADESGNFDFSRKPGASRYFILTPVSASDCSMGDALLALRRDLAWRGVGLGTEFHATEDEQKIRDEVFGVIANLSLRVDATILEKAKAESQVRGSDERFYQTAWFFHLRHVAKQAASSNDEMLVVGASLGTKKKKEVFHDAVADVVGQVAPMLNYRTAFWSAASEPCLQVADYCSWAIQRKWERNDLRSYALIQKHITTEFDLWRGGRTLYY
jgi:Protein of unknown function (DUF3800)